MESYGGGALGDAPVEQVRLGELRPGERAFVVRFEGGAAFRGRMVSMGIVPGRQIEVLSGRRRHPFLVRAGATRIMIGWGMLDRVIVRRAGRLDPALPRSQGEAGNEA